MELPAFVLGQSVQIINNGEKIYGDVFAFDEESRLLILQEDLHHNPSRKNFRFINLNAIEGFNSESIRVADNPSHSVPLGRLPEINLQRVKDREAYEVNLHKSKIGVNVSKEGQLLFDCLSRTFPTRWKGVIIEIMGIIEIRPPYDLNDCVDPVNPNSSELQYVKKVLAGEKKKVASILQEELAPQ